MRAFKEIKFFGRLLFLWIFVGTLRNLGTDTRTLAKMGKDGGKYLLL